MSDGVSTDAEEAVSVAFESDENRNPAAPTDAAENNILRRDRRYRKCASDALL
jgi:hypothetical protein